jgi:hypothetical protein
MTEMSERQRFTYCRVCGDRWYTLSLLERHKPDCPLLEPETGFSVPERPRGTNTTGIRQELS